MTKQKDTVAGSKENLNINPFTVTDCEEPKRKIGVFSFFSGAGFLDLGFEKTKGFEILFVNEFHKPFMEVYRASREALKLKKPRYGHSTDDICELLQGDRAAELEKNVCESRTEFDVIGFIGGPPCPDFSVAGKNKGSEGENGKLSETYINLIIKNQPDFFLFENVKGLYRTSKHREFFEKIKLKLASNGYTLTEKLINALEYGAPQYRERIILIGFRKAFIEPAEPESISDTMSTFDWGSSTTYNIKSVLARPWPKSDVYEEGGSLAVPRGVAKSLTVQHWFEKNRVTEHFNADDFFQPRAALYKFQTIQEGDDLKKSFKRLHRWRFSPTAAYGNNEVHLHPYRSRRISVAEALAIQSLPKEFVIPKHISLSNMFKTIGNGVPYLAAKGLAETIKNHIYVTNFNFKT